MNDPGVAEIESRDNRVMVRVDGLSWQWNRIGQLESVKEQLGKVNSGEADRSGGDWNQTAKTVIHTQTHAEIQRRAADMLMAEVRSGTLKAKELATLQLLLEDSIRRKAKEMTGDQFVAEMTRPAIDGTQFDSIRDMSKLGVAEKVDVLRVIKTTNETSERDTTEGLLSPLRVQRSNCVDVIIQAKELRGEIFKKGLLTGEMLKQEQILTTFSSMGEGVSNAFHDMAERYARKILAGEDPAKMGVPMGMREEVKERVEALRNTEPTHKAE
jgi:hypothetical protein